MQRFFAPLRMTILRFWLGEAGECEESGVDDDEEAFGASQDGPVGALDFCLMEELAPFTVEVAAGEDKRLIEGDGVEIVDLHVAGHGEDVEGTVELAHGFVEEGGYYASVNVTRGAFVEAVELELGGGSRGLGVGGFGGEDEMEALGIRGPAAEAVAGSLVDVRI